MIILKGKVSSGTRDSSENPARQKVEPIIKEKMGFAKIERGTLNIEIECLYANIDDGNYVYTIPAEDFEGKQYIKLKRCRMMGIKCVIVRPKHHFNQSKFRKRIEITSPYRLRDKLTLKDGDRVEVELQGDDSWWTAAEIN